MMRLVRVGAVACRAGACNVVVARDGIGLLFALRISKLLILLETRRLRRT
jgi:hypothetical protein